MLRYIKKILTPYKKETCERLGLPETQKAVLLLDVFAAHRGELFIAKLKEAGWAPVFIPGGCTGELQPLDLSCNKLLKEELRNKFVQWYASELEDLEKRGETQLVVDFSLSKIKELHSAWLVAALSSCSRPEVLVKGWRFLEEEKTTMFKLD